MRDPARPALDQGKRAEESACEHLCSQGLTVVEKNYRCRAGEIDLIMEDGSTLVFVEVRYRSSRRFGGSAESIDRRKKERIIRTASHYLQHHPRLATRPARFDVVLLEPPKQVFWIKDAFQA